MSKTEWSQGGRRPAETKFEGRQAIITKAARTCFERKGLNKTSIADITREVSITRELFYYYFPRRELVVDAVMASFVNDGETLLRRAMDLVAQESSSADSLTYLTGVIAALRAWLQLDGDSPRSMVDLLREAGSLPQVSYQLAEQAISLLCEREVIAPEDVESLQVEALRTLLVGVMTEMQRDDAPTNKELAAQAALLLA